MKYVITDYATQLVLAQTTEKRVATLLKLVIADIRIYTVLSGPHAELYNLITDSYIAENMFRFRKFNCVPAFDVTEEILEKKRLARIKTEIVEKIIKLADIKINEHQTFFDPHMLYIISENNNIMIEEYALIRNISVSEAKKELILRKGSYDMYVIKIQALIDKWVESMALTNDVDKLSNFEADIEQDFFHR
jgi:hypothetical protein